MVEELVPWSSVLFNVENVSLPDWCSEGIKMPRSWVTVNNYKLAKAVELKTVESYDHAAHSVGIC